MKILTILSSTIVVLAMLCTGLSFSSATRSSEVELIIVNDTGGDINVTLGSQVARLTDKEKIIKHYKTIAAIPQLTIAATQARYGMWWKPLNVDIMQKIRQKFPEGQERGKRLQLTITSSKVWGFIAEIDEAKEAPVPEGTSLSRFKSAWDAFPAVQKELLTPGWIVSAYTPEQLNVLLDSKDEAQRANKIRLARLVLNLPSDYKPENVRTNYRQQSLKYHYDRQDLKERDKPEIKKLSLEITTIIQKAKDILEQPAH